MCNGLTLLQGSFKDQGPFMVCHIIQTHILRLSQLSLQLISKAIKEMDSVLMSVIRFMGQNPCQTLTKLIKPPKDVVPTMTSYQRLAKSVCVREPWIYEHYQYTKTGSVCSS